MIDKVIFHNKEMVVEREVRETDLGSLSSYEKCRVLLVGGNVLNYKPNDVVYIKSDRLFEKLDFLKEGAYGTNETAVLCKVVE
jgi:hypothetical protein